MVKLELPSKDDEIYGPIRAEICDAYIVAGKPKPERNWLYSRLVRVTLENQELEMLFDLQHSRVTEATKLWQAAHDKPDVLPDLGTLVEWLIQRWLAPACLPWRIRTTRRDRAKPCPTQNPPGAGS
jgi:hypothetical protein